MEGDRSPSEPETWSGDTATWQRAIAIATVGAKFGAGGLGTLLFDGIAQAGRYDKIWAGAIAVSRLAFTINAALLALEWAANPTRRLQWRMNRVRRSVMQRFNPG